jgi:hypothetical protein
MHTELNQLIEQAMTQRSEYEREVIKKAWTDEEFKQRFLSDPKAVIAEEIGETLPDNIEFEVLQETENKVYFVLPNNPIPNVAEEGLSEEALESVAGGISTPIKKIGKGGFQITIGFKNKCVAWSAAHNANDLV